MTFKNRFEAGRLLSEKLIEHKGKKELLVLAIPPGGVIIGKEISLFLDCSLNVLTAKKSDLLIASSDKLVPNLKDKIVILADDGVVTGATMARVVKAIRQQDPKRIVAAVPVIAKESLKKIEELADEVVYLEAPDLFFSLSQFYEDF